MRIATVFSVMMALSFPAFADTTTEAAPGAPADAGAALNSNNLITNVIGSKEAPNVSNIIPWKETGEAKLTKKEVTTSILKETLDPLDPETLEREIEFHKALQGSDAP